MTMLENRIPPPVVALGTAIAMWFLAKVEAPFYFDSVVFKAIAVTLFIAGLAINIASALSFRRAGTTVNPLKPETAGKLVNTGMYRFTRNPMYLGMAIVLLAWFTWLGNPLVIILPVFFVAFITRFQIIPEERALRKLFPDDCETFFSSTRRWI